MKKKMRGKKEKGKKVWGNGEMGKWGRIEEEISRVKKEKEKNEGEKEKQNCTLPDFGTGPGLLKFELRKKDRWKKKRRK